MPCPHGPTAQKMVLKKPNAAEEYLLDDEQINSAMEAQDLRWAMEWEELHGMSKTIAEMKLQVQEGKPLPYEVQRFLLFGKQSWSIWEISLCTTPCYNS